MNKIGTKFVVVGSTYEIVSESSFNGVPHWGFQLRQPSWGWNVQMRKVREGEKDLPPVAGWIPKAFAVDGVVATFGS